MNKAERERLPDSIGMNNKTFNVYESLCQYSYIFLDLITMHYYRELTKGRFVSEEERKSPEFKALMEDARMKAKHDFEIALRTIYEE